MHSGLVLPSVKWSDQTIGTSEIVLCKIGDHTSSSSEVESTVILTMRISASLSWSVIVNGINITTSCDAIKHLPQPFKPTDDINSILRYIDSLVICPGHPDEHFVAMINNKKKKSGTRAQIDTSNDVSLKGKVYSATVRVSSCHLLVCSGKCPTCKAYRPTLRKMHSRLKTKGSPTKHVSSSSRTNFRYLKTPLQQQRVAQMRSRIVSAERKVSRLRKKIETSVARSGVQVDSDMHQDLTTIVEEHTPTIHEQFKEGTFKRLFWEQQREALKAGPRQMRWHPTMIKWCLNIKLHSTKTYEALRR